VFDTATARYVLRAFLVGVAGTLAALQAHGTPVSWEDVYKSVIAGAVLALAYAGIGAASPAVEPNIGIKREP
jgi:hypothetical protein